MKAAAVSDAWQLGTWRLDYAVQADDTTTCDVVALRAAAAVVEPRAAVVVVPRAAVVVVPRVVVVVAPRAVVAVVVPRVAVVVVTKGVLTYAEVSATSPAVVAGDSYTLSVPCVD